MLVASVALAFVVRTAVNPVHYPNVPWPLPQDLIVGNKTVVFLPNTSLSCAKDTWCDQACTAPGLLTRGFERTHPRLSPPSARKPDKGEAVIDQVVVCVRQPFHEFSLPGPDTNESYILRVPSLSGSAVQIDAETVFGALWGLESLSQLVSFISPGRVVNAPVAITDAPRFPVRGLMVDPAINFMPINFLHRVVDGLTANKMNYLHIHFTDVTSFPVASTLVCIGALSTPFDLRHRPSSPRHYPHLLCSGGFT